MFSIFTNFPKPNKALNAEFAQFPVFFQSNSNLYLNFEKRCQPRSKGKQRKKGLRRTVCTVRCLRRIKSSIMELPSSSSDWISKLHSLRKLNTMTSPYYSCGLTKAYSGSSGRWKSLRKFGLQSAGGCPHSLPQWVDSCDVVPPVPFTRNWLIQLIQFSVDKLMNIPDRPYLSLTQHQAHPQDKPIELTQYWIQYSVCLVSQSCLAVRYEIEKGLRAVYV